MTVRFGPRVPRPRGAHPAASGPCGPCPGKWLWSAWGRASLQLITPPREESGWGGVADAGQIFLCSRKPRPELRPGFPRGGPRTQTLLRVSGQAVTRPLPDTGPWLSTLAGHVQEKNTHTADAARSGEHAPSAPCEQDAEPQHYPGRRPRGPTCLLRRPLRGLHKACPGQCLVSTG